MKKADFDNLLQGVRELKAARQGALPAGSVRDRRWVGAPAAFDKNTTTHDMEFIRTSSAASGRKQRTL